jgi:hypothetical protein
MPFRTRAPWALLAALVSLGASYRSAHFAVEAPTEEVAQAVAEAAEQHRKEQALRWLGKEMPDWPRPLPIRVSITMGGAGGATSFTFDQGRILSQDMHVEGSLERLLASVIPHEVTHTVFAHRFRCPVPRWADEGGCILSEDDRERDRHDALVRQILRAPGRAIPLGRLFALKDYPRDVMVLYAEGYSVTRFLVEAGGRRKFLDFIAAGTAGDWNDAAHTHYHYKNVEKLEQAWLRWVHDKKETTEDRTTSRVQELEAEVRLLRLENQLLKHQLAGERLEKERKAWQEEHDRLRKKVEAARQAAEEARRR